MTQRLNEAQSRKAFAALARCLDKPFAPFQLEGPTIPTGVNADKYDDRTEDVASSGKPTTASSTNAVLGGQNSLRHKTWRLSPTEPKQ